jgi:flagellar biogenesis protein FliO
MFTCGAIRRFLIGWLALGLAGGDLISTHAVAGPPKIIDEDDESVERVNFAEPEELEVSPSLTPRNATQESRARNVTQSTAKPWANTSLWGTVVGLFAVLGAGLAARVWMTRHGPLALRGLPVEALELLGRRTIEPRVSIHLVRCGPKILVLGVSPDGVRTLTEITDPIEIDLLAGTCRRKVSDRHSSSPFSTRFRQSETGVPQPRLREN